MSNRIVQAIIALSPLVFTGALDSKAAEKTTDQEPIVSCPITRGPVTSNVLLRVFPVRVGTQQGTAFTLEIEGLQYIVTAKHLVDGDIPATIEIGLDEWTPLPVKLVGHGKGEHDILVLATDSQVSPAFPVDVGSGDIIVGQSVRFLGYFPTIRTSPMPGDKRRGTPLVMGGTMSGMYFAEDGEEGSSFWIDGHNNKGFSGGPVVFEPQTARSVEACRWKIAGVISGYAPAPIDVRTITGGTTAAVAISNAGLLRAIPIKSVRDLIMKNPIGFPVRQ